jgi:hypothetical protein
MNSIARNLAALGLCVVAGCSKTGGGGNDTGGLVGSVQDAITGTPIQGVQVTGPDGASATTDAMGLFLLTGLAPGRPSLTFKATGYASTQRPLEVSAGFQRAVNLKMMPFESEPVDPSIGGIVTGRGANASVPIGGFAGPVVIYLTGIDPASDDQLGTLPGDASVEEGGEVKTLGAHGGLAIEARDQSGNLVQPAAGMTIGIAIPAVAPPGGTLPPTVPIYYFDEATGTWKLEGTGTLLGDAYLAEVSHFTSFGAFDLHTSTCLTVCVAEEGTGKAVPNVNIYAKGLNHFRSGTSMTGGNGCTCMDVASARQVRVEALHSSGKKTQDTTTQTTAASCRFGGACQAINFTVPTAGGSAGYNGTYTGNGTLTVNTIAGTCTEPIAMTLVVNNSAVTGGGTNHNITGTVSGTGAFTGVDNGSGCNGSAAVPMTGTITGAGVFTGSGATTQGGGCCGPGGADISVTFTANKN